MADGLVDRIYEAAFVPELWPSVLEGVGLAAGATTGAILSMSGSTAPRWRATDAIRDTIEDFVRVGQWQDCERPRQLMSLGYPGFLCDEDYLTPDQAARDPVRRRLMALSLGWQLGTLVAMPTGEIVGFTFERPLDRGRPGPEDLSTLDALRPHLARAGLIATRLGLERAVATVSALEALGVPAAVMSTAGRVLGANALLEALPGVFVPVARGGIALGDAAANALFQAAAHALDESGAQPRSIPIPERDGQPALVVHVLPLRRSAHDIFSGADILVAATAISVGGMVPSLSLLHGLFDLTPAEARIAASLAGGRSLREAAAEAGLKFSTVRSYLELIFRKTGTNQQSQLVALLKSAGPPLRRPEGDRPA